MMVAARDGVAALTLDAVAAESGVSKGGLLYHFATKEHLLHGLVRDCLDRWSADLAARIDSDPRPGGAGARAYVSAVAGPDHDPVREMALLAATALEPSTADLWRETAMEWTAGDADPPADDERIVDLLLVRLAADGLWLARTLDLYDLTNERLAAVAKRLHEMTGPAVGAT
ncbi:TetR family transcriptional regulator [soil metagenome]